MMASEGNSLLKKCCRHHKEINKPIDTPYKHTCKPNPETYKKDYMPWIGDSL